MSVVGPVTVILYPWGVIFGVLAVASGLIAGWRRARVWIIVGGLSAIISTLEVVILGSLHS